MSSIYYRGDFYACPNPLSADPYNVCEYNCAFCFTKEMEATFRKEATLLPRSTKELRLALERAFDKKAEDTLSHLLRAGIPVIIGRKCEPFCPSESIHKATYDFLGTLNQFEVPTIVETKGLGNIKTLTYFDDVGLNISVTPGSDDLCRKMEPKTPLYSERLEFAKRARESGLWVGIKCEPILHGINDSPPDLARFASLCADANVDHVNFGDYRIFRLDLAKKRLAEVGINIRDIIKAKKETWPAKGFELRDHLKSYGLKVSSPDWVHFSDLNDCVSCCGLEKHHNFNWQTASKILQSRDDIHLSDLVDSRFFGEEDHNKFRGIWNSNGTKYFTLADMGGVQKAGIDSRGDSTYSRCSKLG